MNRNKWMTLLISVVVILSFVLSACTQATPTAAPAATKPPAAPAATQPPAAPAPSGKYKEAPMLAEQVKAGKLPPVDQRLPENPAVVEAAEIGQYGGVWRRGFLGPSDFNGVARVIYDALVIFAPDGGSVVMKYAESVTPSPDFKSWTVKLRKGSKWSNGDPFTTDDIMFWYKDKDALQNKDLMPSPPGWMKNKDGSLAQVKQVDAVTAQWDYKDPHTTFLFELANAEYGDKNIPCFLPSKFLKQFHASYAKQEDLDKMVAEAKLKTWAELFRLKISPYDTPERPGMAAWRLAVVSAIRSLSWSATRTLSAWTRPATNCRTWTELTSSSLPTRTR